MEEYETEEQATYKKVMAGLGALGYIAATGLAAVAMLLTVYSRQLD